ncbi:hypothetical protein WJX84_005212 [Apatococcus fuscideae]|uniref:Uncharacterized protein n=1 Tax=Apatococcus fuscideae TaxID=2026836 RepID=A0AAW1SWY2_9CHLO
MWRTIRRQKFVCQIWNCRTPPRIRMRRLACSGHSALPPQEALNYNHPVHDPRAVSLCARPVWSNFQLKSQDIWKTMLGYIIAAQQQAAGQGASGSGAGSPAAAISFTTEFANAIVNPSSRLVTSPAFVSALTRAIRLGNLSHILYVTENFLQRIDPYQWQYHETDRREVAKCKAWLEIHLASWNDLFILPVTSQSFLKARWEDIDVNIQDRLSYSECVRQSSFT